MCSSILAGKICTDLSLKHPLISDDCKGIVEHSWLLYQLGVSFDEGSEPVLWHVGGQVVEHAALAEQGMGLDGVGLEIMPRLSLAASSRVSRTTANALSSSSAAGGLRCGPRRGPCRSADPWCRGSWAPLSTASSRA